MKNIFKMMCVLSLATLAACNAKNAADSWVGGAGNPPAEKVANQPLQGSMSGSSWVLSRAVGKVQPDGMLMISISGNGEVINCSYSSPFKPGVLFTVPMKVAEYDFDMLRPNEGYGVTWVYTDAKSSIQNSFSDTAHISITSVTADHLGGGLSAKFMDPSSPGNLNGLFEAVICP
jgi:hypothetical protein